ncbi:TetR/AcrR family transcriptional regulator [Aquabacterium sp. A7-Y]|uniref:TetR/AcrR family transcriptional regulator n=1 Tax=Aquabacterium sp. A7-Y TaxID=1349605 RepID=UPI00223E1CC8|nr:TetR/AcrR family transcriptional regulator [Aquabacterium sp. A7-Y]MCW7540605.1 TetR/AcrR family transcriptional regulator [Aquabacterium sp. A7-Y]
MSAVPKHREALVASAAHLFRRRGYNATGIQDILRHSGAPRGSLYHYFPRGKVEIAAAAVRFAGEQVRLSLLSLRREHAHPADLMRAYAQLLGDWMEVSRFRDGCPVTTTLLELAADVPEVAASGRQALAAWAEVFEQELLAHGAEPARAGRIAQLAISALEGALVQARVLASRAPIENAADEMARLMEAVAPRTTA